jgi:hypothetical protein
MQREIQKPEINCNIATGGGTLDSCPFNVLLSLSV